MAERWAAILLLTGTLATATYLSIRLDFFGLRNRRGLSPFLFGLFLVICSLVWQIITLSPSYSDWFVPSAYLIAAVIQAFAATVGVFLCGWGIIQHDRHWHDERGKLLRREEMLSMLENLQHDARQPYQLLELLDISLREMLSHLPQTCGAIFLTNRTRRQFVLTASHGLAKDEIAALEHYPLDRNLLSQAVGMAEPLIAPGFDFVDPDGSTHPSRFQSVMVLPLIAGMEQIGGLLLFSDTPKRFDRQDARVLTPVTEWLAERIRATRLTREVTTIRTDRDKLTTQLQSLHDRVGGAVASLEAPDPLGAFCRSLVGLFDCTGVHLCSIRSGRLEFLSHSSSMGELSDSYQTALIEAIDRRKPLLINQETTDESGRDCVVAATLALSLGGHHAHEAILFRREAGGMAITDPSLHTLELLARLAGLAIDYVEIKRHSLSQRTGFERVMRLLNPETVEHRVTAEWFVRELEPAFLNGTGFAILTQGQDKRWRVSHPFHIDESVIADMVINPQEGEIGQIASGRPCLVLMGRTELSRWIGQFQPGNRQILSRLIGPSFDRTFVAICPLRNDLETSIVLVIASGMTERSRDEYARLLTLACALYSFRGALDQRRLGRSSLVPENIQKLDTAILPQSDRQDLAEEIRRTLSRSRISGDLYMLSGRPREIHAKFQSTDSITCSASLLQSLVGTAIDGFASAASDEDVITISLYNDQSHVYLDLSRHRRYFPPVEPVAGFGSYRHITESNSDTLTQSMLTPIVGGEVWYAADRQNPSPTFLSFKFPKRSAPTGSDINEVATARPRILVIDDQAVILDLVAAMCQTIGYSVDQARSGEVGLRLSGEHDYALILVDLAMPGLSGLEVARMLKRQKPDVPVVLMTGWEASLDRASLDDAGIVEVLYKPFRIEQLSDLLKSFTKARPTL